jgi:hypothetical protein
MVTTCGQAVFQQRLTTSIVPYLSPAWVTLQLGAAYNTISYTRFAQCLSLCFSTAWQYQITDESLCLYPLSTGPNNKR